ncbi:15096_t:CDS:2 [Funneliformis mosseae]|uniref:15096_t:CDS:1 n=1 Tax=Funneliformis mosseae TaxID=27381 RepID=A0A9N8VNY9_FUNMO|nr:15096_t:CDS:2 [Funneliformis mosseae]
MQDNSQETIPVQNFADLQIEDSLDNKPESRGTGRLLSISNNPIDNSLIDNTDFDNHIQPENYCYRHRPDLMRERMAEELTLNDLQKQIEKLSQSERETVTHIWSLFSAAPPQNRCLILQGILIQCCLPQLSFLSDNLKDLIRIDFIAALPRELSFKILSYLDAISLCYAAQVSKSWKYIADDNVVWHKLCEQHIDRKCYKCGWGLPLLEQKRRCKNNKRPVSNNTLTSYSTVATCSTAIDIQRQSMRHLQTSSPSSSSIPSYMREIKRARISNDRSSALYPDISKPEPRQTRPWKDVYRERLLVERNWRKGRYNVRVLKGHTDGILCLQFDDVNNRLISGSLDNTVCVWNLETGEIIRVMKEHTRCVRALQFDDTKLITGSMDGTVKIWNYYTGQCLRTFPHTSGIVSLHFDDLFLASGSTDHIIKVWNFASCECFVFKGHTDCVNRVVIYKQSQLLSCSDDLTIRIWDLKTKSCTRVFDQNTHVASIQCIQPALRCNATPFNELLGEKKQRKDSDKVDEPVIVSGSLDSTIKMWSLETGQCIRTLFGHVEGVWSLAVDKLRVVSGAHDKTVKIWDQDSGECMHTLFGHTGAVNCVALSDTKIISGSEDSEIRIWDFKN